MKGKKPNQVEQERALVRSQLNREYVRFLIASEEEECEISFDYMNELLEAVNLPKFDDIESVEELVKKGTSDIISKITNLYK